MRAKKRGTARLGLAVLAMLGLMGLTAVGARANWLVLLTDAPTNLADKTEVEANAHTAITLLIPKKNIEIVCTTLKGETLLLRTAPEGTGEGKLAFSGCTTYSLTPELKAQPNCNPINQPIKAAGLAQVILHTNGDNYVLLKPHSGKAFTTIEYSELCALTETSTLGGSLVAECGHLAAGSFVHLDCKAHRVIQLFRQVPGTTLFPSDKLIYGLSSEATLDGIAAVSVKGIHAGFAWGGHV
jgi:hypothetical protein